MSTNIYKPQSLLDKIHKSKQKQLLKLKRPIKSFKRSFKQSNSLLTQVKRDKTNILHSGLSKEMRDLKKLNESCISIAYGSLRLFLEQTRKVLKIEEKPNYVIEDYKNPPKKNIIGWRRKKIKDKDGYEHIINLAIVKDPKTGKTKTVATSLWHSKKEPKAKKLLKSS